MEKDKARLFRKLDQAYEQFTDKLIINNGIKTVTLSTTEIMYIKSVKNVLQIFTAKNEYTVRMTIENLEARLKHPNFIRTHRSYIVNVAYVDSFDDHFAYFKGSHLADISRNKKKEFIWALEKHLKR